MSGFVAEDRPVLVIYVLADEINAHFSLYLSNASTECNNFWFGIHKQQFMTNIKM